MLPFFKRQHVLFDDFLESYFDLGPCTFDGLVGAVGVAVTAGTADFFVLEPLTITVFITGGLYESINDLASALSGAMANTLLQ